jgi:hypothetical protein
MGVFDSIRDKMMRSVSSEKPDEAAMMDAMDQPKEDQELCAFVKNRIDESRNMANRVAHEGVWMTNTAYVLGFDGVYYDTGAKQFRPTNTATPVGTYLKRNRVHENLILPACQNRLSRMLKNPPRYDVLPNSMDEEDKEGARLGMEVIGCTFDKQQVNRKRIDLGMWKQQCGHAYIGVSWDDQLGEPMVDPITGEFVGFEGQTRLDVVSAFEGFPDPLAKTFDELGWFGRCKVRKLDYFKSHYTRGNLVKEEGAWLLSAQYEMRINSLNTTGTASSGGAEQMKNAAIEISYYEKRSKKHPRGRHIIVANGVLLKNDKLPVGEIPYAKFDDIVVGGKYFSETPVTHARPLQDQYNRCLVKRAAWTNRLLAGKYMAARGHGLTQEAMNDQSGEVVEYDVVPNASPPTPMAIPNIPSYAYQETAEYRKQLYECFGLSEISRGQLPSAGIPALGMQILLEQDETRMGIEVEADELAWARVGMLVLKYEGEFCKTDRKLKTKGKGLKTQIKHYKGEDLKGNYDVRVVRGSTVPNSKVIKRQEILNLMGQGLLGDPRDPAVVDKVLGQLEFGEVGEVWEDYHLDMSQIKRDIELIEQGIPPEVNKLDNHALHVIMKNRERKNEKWDEMPPMIRELLEANIEQHADAAVALMHPELVNPPPDPPLPPNLAMQQEGIDPLAPTRAAGGPPGNPEQAPPPMLH